MNSFNAHAEFKTGLEEGEVRVLPVIVLDIHSRDSYALVVPTENDGTHRKAIYVEKTSLRFDSGQILQLQRMIQKEQIQ